MKSFSRHSLLFRVAGVVLCAVLTIGLCAATPALASSPRMDVRPESVASESDAGDDPVAESPAPEDPEADAESPAEEIPVAEDPSADAPASDPGVKNPARDPDGNDPAPEDPIETDQPATSAEEPSAPEPEPVIVSSLAPESPAPASSDNPVGGHGLGYVAPPVQYFGVNDFNYTTVGAVGGIQAMADLPASFDYRTTGGILTAIRNQNPYGTCWAFAALASAAGSLVKQGLATSAPELSPYHLTYAVYNPQAYATQGGQDPKNAGGNTWKAATVMSRWASPVAEFKFPYSMIGSGASLSAAQIHQSDYHLTQELILPVPLTYNGSWSQTNLNTVKSALMTYGPLSTAYHAASESGSYNPQTYGWYNAARRNADHAVTLVGWDDNYPATKFLTPPPGPGAFLIQNSWGSGWGDGGFFWLSYYDQTIAGFEHLTLGAADNYSRVYSHDDIGYGDGLAYGVSTFGGNVFLMPDDAAKANTDEKQAISAVSFHLIEPGMSYEIFAYRGMTPSPSTPVTGKQIDLNGAADGLTVSGSQIYAGYYTIPVSMNSALLNVGERYSIVVKFTSSSGSYGYVPVERAYVPGDYVTINRGESFISANALGWNDVSGAGNVGNICIKTFTNDAGTPVSMFVSGQKTTYGLGEPFDGETGTATISYSSGMSETIPLSQVSVSGFDTSTTGAKTVALQYGNAMITYDINVIKAVRTIRIPQSTFYVVKGKTLTIPYGYDLMPGVSGSVKPMFKWASGNSKNVSVTSTGKVKGVKAGKSAKITVSSFDGVRKTITVKVVQSAMKTLKVSVSGAPKTMKVGRTKILKAKISPATATGAAVAFSLDSKSKKIVSVDKGGKVTALKKGAAKITVKAGGKKTVIMIKVR